MWEELQVLTDSPLGPLVGYAAPPSPPQTRRPRVDHVETSLHEPLFEEQREGKALSVALQTCTLPALRVGRRGPPSPLSG